MLTESGTYGRDPVPRRRRWPVHIGRPNSEKRDTTPLPTTLRITFGSRVRECVLHPFDGDEVTAPDAGGHADTSHSAPGCKEGFA
jgi:hypothetical protein